MRRFTALAIFAFACSGGDKSTAVTDDTGSGGEGGGSPEDYLDVTVTPIGDFGDFGGYDANGEWLVQTPDTSLAAEVVLSGSVNDFQTEDGVVEATVKLWYSDDSSTSPDQTFTSDTDGSISANIMTCSPVAYLTATDPDREETKDTFQSHNVYDAGDQVAGAEFNSVSDITYQLIPSLLGVSPDLDKGIVAGAAYDSNGDNVEGAQVVVVDDDGVVPSSVIVNYFINDFPQKEQEYTSADGLWIAINIPTGEWNVNMYVADGAGGHLLMGSTRLSVVADSINISSIYAGYGDGVKYPDSCLSAG